MPQPLLSLAYLAALRSGRLRPSFVPLVVLATFPIASAVIGAGGHGGSRARRLGLLGVALLELLWTVLAQAMVGFAIAWQSG